MATHIKPDPQAECVDGLERHYYERQLGPTNPFDDQYQFKLAAARAKDKARHLLVKAVRKAARDARFNRSVGRELTDVLTGRQATVEKRFIDGVEGASDEAIKL